MEQEYEKRGYLLEDFRLFHLRDAAGPDVDYHYHDFHKLLLLLSGSGAYVIEGQRYLLRPGDIVLVGRGSVHRPEIAGGQAYERVILYLSPDFLRRSADADCAPEELFSGGMGPVLRLSGAQAGLFSARIAALERELGSRRPGRLLMGRCLLLGLLVELYREARQEGSALPLPAEPGDAKVQDILRYLNGHLTEDITIDALAESFYISKYHMMRRFREETGTPIHAYLSDKRLFLARDLIAGGATATESCYQCGFKSYSSFSRAYLKRFGTSPTGRTGTIAEDIVE